jgi:hypothetical protein
MFMHLALSIRGDQTVLCTTIPNTNSKRNSRTLLCGNLDEANERKLFCIGFLYFYCKKQQKCVEKNNAK